MASSRRMHRIVAATAVVVLLAVVPTQPRAFFTPKLWVFGVGTALSLFLVRRASLRPAALALGGTVIVSSALSMVTAEGAPSAPGLLLIVFGASVAAWPSIQIDRRGLARALASGGAVVGAITLLQAAGFDPLPSAGLTGRLRTYGTLGNPDFVASALVPCLAVTVALATGPRRALWIALAAVQLAALVPLRSFATVLALGAALAVAAFRVPPERRLALFALAGVALALVAPSGRSWRTSLEGRVYLNAVALPAAVRAPPFGYGPGSVEALWPVLEIELWKARCGEDAACVSAHPQRRFAALQDHVHDDYLEAWVERGPVGLVLLLALAVWSVAHLRRDRSALGVAALAGVVALLARAAFDFPLARPGDLALWSALLALPEDPPS